MDPHMGFKPSETTNIRICRHMGALAAKNQNFSCIFSYIPFEPKIPY